MNVSISASNELVVPKFFSCIQECKGLVQQIPTTLFLGTTNVGLTCLDVGENYIVIGSNCGALFIYNRRLSRFAAPLRTNYDEVVTCLKFCTAGGDILAAGHASGLLIFISLPSPESNLKRKMDQRIQVCGHYGHSITFVEWNESGRSLVSADNIGNLIITYIDFESDQMKSTLIHSEASTLIYNIRCSASYIVACSSESILIFELNYLRLLNRICLLPFMESFSQIGIQFDPAEQSGHKSLIISSDGCLYFIDIHTGCIIARRDFAKKVPAMSSQYAEKADAFCMNSKLYAINGRLLSIGDNKRFSVINGSNLELLYHEEISKSLIQSDIIHFALDVMVDMTLFCLTDDRRIFRISCTKAPVSLIESTDNAECSVACGLLSSLNKATKLLPFAPTSAILRQLKASGNESARSTIPKLQRALPIRGITKLDQQQIIQRSNLVQELSEDRKDDGPTDSCIIIDGDRSILSSVKQKVWDAIGEFGLNTKDGFIPISDDAKGSLCTSKAIVVNRLAKNEYRKQKPQGCTSSDWTYETASNCSKEDISHLCESVLDDIRKTLTGENVGIHTCDVSNDQNDLEFWRTDSDADKDFAISPEIVQIMWEIVESIPSLCHGESYAKGEADVTVEGQIEHCKNQLLLPPDGGSRDSSSNVKASDAEAYNNLMKSALEWKATQKNMKNDGGYSLQGNLFGDLSTAEDLDCIWNELKLPFRCSHFTVSSQYIFFTNKKRRRPRFHCFSDTNYHRWLVMKSEADFVEISESGSLLWRVHRGIAYTSAKKYASYADNISWEIIGEEDGGISEVALTSNSAWYITQSGAVYVQLRLPEMGIISRCETFWPVKCITASDCAVWTIKASNGNLVVRAGLKHCPTGYDWVEIEPNGPACLKSICLSGETGWALDSNRSLWFTNGVSFENPFGLSWLRVFHPWERDSKNSSLDTSRNQIRVSSRGVFVSAEKKIFWISNDRAIVGHQFKHVIPERLAASDSFDMLSAVSFGDDDGSALLCKENELFIYRVRSGNLYSLPIIPSTFRNSVKQIVLSNACVYALDSAGCVNIKEDVHDVIPYGAEWMPMNTGCCAAPIMSFAITNISIWVLTSESTIYMCEKNSGISFKNLKLVWEVVQSPSTSTKIDEIRSSTCGSYVWTFSKVSGCGWCRFGISKTFPSGRTWVESGGYTFLDVAVGSSVLWSLSSSGYLHRLHGFSRNNPAGCYWRPTCAKLKAIVIDAKDRLWAIDNDNRLTLHTIELCAKLNICNEENVGMKKRSV